MERITSQPVLDYAVPERLLRRQFISVRAGLSVVLPLLRYLTFSCFSTGSDQFGSVVDTDLVGFATKLVFYVGPFVLCGVMALHSVYRHRPPLSATSYYVGVLGAAINAIAGASQVLSVYYGLLWQSIALPGQ